jgi:hypothetical protein
LKNPLALIETIVFIGAVIWLFTLPSSPLGRRSRESDRSDDKPHETDRG